MRLHRGVLKRDRGIILELKERIVVNIVQFFRSQELFWNVVYVVKDVDQHVISELFDGLIRNLKLILRKAGRKIEVVLVKSRASLLEERRLQSLVEALELTSFIFESINLAHKSWA